MSTSNRTPNPANCASYARRRRFSPSSGIHTTPSRRIGLSPADHDAFVVDANERGPAADLPRPARMPAALGGSGIAGLPRAGHEGHGRHASPALVSGDHRPTFFSVPPGEPHASGRADAGSLSGHFPGGAVILGRSGYRTSSGGQRDSHSPAAGRALPKSAFFAPSAQFDRPRSPDSPSPPASPGGARPAVRARWARWTVPEEIP